MNKAPSFASNLLAVIVGLLFLIMNAVFILVPYALSEHPGDTNIVGAATQAYHPT